MGIPAKLTWRGFYVEISLGSSLQGSLEHFFRYKNYKNQIVMGRGMRHVRNEGRTRSEEQLRHNHRNDYYRDDYDVYVDELNRLDYDEYHENGPDTRTIYNDYPDREYTQYYNRMHHSWEMENDNSRNRGGMYDPRDKNENQRPEDRDENDFDERDYDPYSDSEEDEYEVDDDRDDDDY
jgi:hypothetical protein